MTSSGFPGDFVWGVATSAYQIEGAVDLDGRTPSVWDTFAAQPGKVRDGSTGAVACDHYHRWPQDLDLVRDLGATAYRFSVSWCRIQPDDGGKPNAAGLDFYDRLVDGLVERGLLPLLTAFHWDLPQWAQDAGGWLERDTAHRFADYVGMLADRLGDRVGIWATMNEMFEHAMLGHLVGEHAPGMTLSLERVPTVAHHLLLGHGLAVKRLRAATSRPVTVVNSYAPSWPASDSEADRGVAELYDVLQNRLFTEPILLGRYPELFELMLPAGLVRDGDLDVIATPIDTLGVNYYSVNTIRAIEGEIPLAAEPAPGYPRTGFDWAVVPEGFTQILVQLRDRYGDRLPPLYVTENGCAYPDTVVDGVCDDADRVAYLEAHLSALRQAMDAGVDVRGYFVWSLLDNFEWAEGYTQRFGLVHVDFETQQRTPKRSYAWLRDQIAAQTRP